MQKILLLGLMASTNLCFAVGGPFFNVSGSSTSMSITSNVAGHTYQSAGIKLTSGYIFTNSSECTYNNKGYCIFSIGPSAPKTFSISGSGTSVSATICLNGNGPLSCQNLSYTVGNSPTPPTPTITDYVYVVDAFSDSQPVTLCEANSLGVLSNCLNAGALPPNAGDKARSMTIDYTNNQYAYITYEATGFAPTGGRLQVCQIDPTTKLLSNCSFSSLMAAQPEQIDFLNLGGNGKWVFIASKPTAGTTSAILRCSVNGPVVGMCQSAASITSSGLFGMGIGQQGISFTAFVTNNGANEILNCPITNGNPPTLACTSSLAVSNGPNYISVTNGSLGAFVAYPSNNVYFYPVDNNGALTLTGAVASSAAVFNLPNQAKPNSAGTYAWVANGIGGTVSICKINANKSLGACTDSTQTFPRPHSFAVLSNP